MTMRNKNTDKEYIPYGEEWEKELKKLPKSYLVDMLRKSMIKNKVVEAEL
jgi:hypothetical protein